MTFSELVSNKIEEYTKLNRYAQDEEEKYCQAILEVFTSLIDNGLLDINEKDEDGETILMHIVWTGNINYVGLLVEAGADVNVIDEGYDFALYIAARQGWQEVYNYLAPLTSPELVKVAAIALPKGLTYRQRKNNHAVEAFVDAAFFGYIDVIINAIYQGIDINAICSNGETALHKAIRNNQLSTVRILLEAGANPNLKEEGGWEYPPLMIALNWANVDYAIFQALLDTGSDINDSSSRGETVLMLAILKLNLKAVRELLKLGVDINAKDIHGQTALYYAKEMRKQTPSEYTEPSEIIQLLESYGAIEG
jgi:uncharacterized protein